MKDANDIRELQKMLKDNDQIALGTLLKNSWKNPHTNLDIFQLRELLDSEIIEIDEELSNPDGKLKAIIDWKHLMYECVDARNFLDFMIEHCRNQLTDVLK